MHTYWLPRNIETEGWLTRERGEVALDMKTEASEPSKAVGPLQNGGYFPRPTNGVMVGQTFIPLSGSQVLFIFHYFYVCVPSSCLIVGATFLVHIICHE